jgi:hypothetical protein
MLPEDFSRALERVQDFASPVISGAVTDQATWDPGLQAWNRAD